MNSFLVAPSGRFHCSANGLLIFHRNRKQEAFFQSSKFHVLLLPVTNVNTIAPALLPPPPSVYLILHTSSVRNCCTFANRSTSFRSVPLYLLTLAAISKTTSFPRVKLGSRRSFYDCFQEGEREREKEREKGGQSW